MSKDIMWKMIDESNKETRLVHLSLLRNDEEKSVEVIEAKEIDRTKIPERLERGNSVSIAPPGSRKSALDQVATEGLEREAAKSLCII